MNYSKNEMESIILEMVHSPTNTPPSNLVVLNKNRVELCCDFRVHIDAHQNSTEEQKWVNGITGSAQHFIH